METLLNTFGKFRIAVAKIAPSDVAFLTDVGLCYSSVTLLIHIFYTMQIF